MMTKLRKCFYSIKMINKDEIEEAWPRMEGQDYRHVALAWQGRELHRLCLSLHRGCKYSWDQSVMDWIRLNYSFCVPRGNHCRRQTKLYTFITFSIVPVYNKIQKRIVKTNFQNNVKFYRYITLKPIVKLSNVRYYIEPITNSKRLTFRSCSEQKSQIEWKNFPQRILRSKSITSVRGCRFLSTV